MRVFKEYRTEAAKISIFSFNEKWIVKCDAGLCEQTFKFSHEEFDLARVEEICQRSSFIERLGQRFKDMHNEFQRDFKDQSDF
jgi:hypothetical protein